MVCKFHEVLDFVREYNLLNDLDDDAVRENFDIFHHACSFDKGLHANEVDCDNPNIVETILDKIMEILDDAFDHEYTKDAVRNIAQNFCGVFEDAKAPKKSVPFIVVILARL